MTSLRQQFTDLAQELSADADRRRQFVAKNRQETQRLCEQFKRERAQLAQQIRHEGQKAARELAANRQTIRRSVTRTLADLSMRRKRVASDQRNQRRRFVAGIQRGVALSLQRSRANLISNAKQRVMLSNQTMMRLRSRVSKLRSETARLRSSHAKEMLAGRRALASARSRRQLSGLATSITMPSS